MLLFSKKININQHFQIRWARNEKKMHLKSPTENLLVLLKNIEIYSTKN